MTDALPTLAVEIVSDLVCPWCFIGLRRFERAAAAVADRARVVPRFVPYRISPDVGPAGEDYRAHLLGKFKTEAKLGEVWARVADVGRADGITFAFESIARMPDSLPGHRLMQCAQAEGAPGVAQRLLGALFVAHFTDGRDTGDAAVLRALAVEAGLDGDRVDAVLASDAYGGEVFGEMKAMELLGVRGVPAFIVDRERGVSGAQPAETLVNFFDECIASGAGVTT